jgi:ankyrin repeat protein
VDTLRRNFPASIRSALNDLPKTLDDTYGRTLLGIDEEKREFTQRLFRCLMVSVRPLRVEELAEILAFRFHEAAPPTFNAAWRPADAEEAVMSACSSLIAIVCREGQKIVQFSHFSVKEFLTSKRLATAEERLSYYHILPEPAHTILAHASLGVLLQLDDKIDRDAISHFPLALYAAQHWVDHAQFKDVAAQIQHVMERLFDKANSHFAAWVWLYDVDRHWKGSMSETHPTQPEALPLYYASLCGFCSLVEHLIVAHSPDSSDVHSRGGFHVTSLHAASAKGHPEVASLLLRNGADPNSRDDKGRVPLHRVSQGGPLVKVQLSLEVARPLINSGANVNATDHEGRTPLHGAASNGYRDIAELLLESGASLDARNELQRTPLHLACENGKLEVSRFLVDWGADLNTWDEQGLSIVHAASQNGHVDVVRLLLDRGADVNAHEIVDDWTPLHFASRHGYLDLARLLVENGADLSAQENDGWTPLQIASGYGCLDVARLLIDNGADLKVQDKDGWTPLQVALAKGYLDIARLLIDNDADLNVQEKDGWTPLHFATALGYLDIARLLIGCVFWHAGPITGR